MRGKAQKREQLIPDAADSYQRLTASKIRQPADAISNPDVQDAIGKIQSAFEAAVDDSIPSEKGLDFDRELLDTIINNIPSIVCIRDLEGRLLMLNDNMSEVMKMSKEEALGTTKDVYLSEEEADLISKRERQVVATGMPQHNEEVLTIDGVPTTFITNRFPIRGRDGKTCGICTVTTDITERKQEEERLYKIFKFSPVPMFVTQIEDGTCILVNDAMENLVGYKRKEAIGRSLKELCVWMDEKRRSVIIEEVLNKGRVTDVEIDFRKRNGELASGIISAELIRINGKDYLLSVVVDITGRKRMEENLRQSEERFRQAFNKTPLIMSINRLTDGTYLDVNEAWQKTFRISKSRAIGQTAKGLGILVVPGERYKKLFKPFIPTRILTDIEFDLKKPDGEVITLLVSAHTTNIDGQPCMLMSATDITRRKLREEVKLSNQLKIATLESRQKLDRLKKVTAQSVGLDRYIFINDEMRQTHDLAMKYHENRTIPILIQGETGTGKEMLAKLIHYGDFENITQFVDINCAAINPSLFESELFGYEAGSFTGGLSKGQLGKFDLAAGGTLFLDEITEIPYDLQAKLLRVLEEKEFYRVGGLKKVKTNVRIICATNADIEKCVEKGSFRKDLYYRLKVGFVYLPPLAQRKDIIIPIARYFLSTFSEQKGKEFRTISKEAADILETYPWPGNIRELKNVMDWVTFMFDDRELVPGHLDILKSFNPGSGKNEDNRSRETHLHSFSNGTNMNDHINQLIQTVLRSNNGNIRKTAAELGISRSAIYNRLKTINNNVQ